MLSMRGIFSEYLQKNWRVLKGIKGWNATPSLSATPYSRMCKHMSTSKTPHEAVRTVKVFQPALSDSEFAKVETEERKVPHREEEPPMPRYQRVRTLGKLDKLLLVKIGKYKKLSDVPDKIIVGDLKRKKEVDEEMRHLFLGSVFKYLYFFEYASFFITFVILGYSLYWYNNYKKLSDDTSEKPT